MAIEVTSVTTVPGLPQAAPITGAELVPVSQNGSLVRTTTSLIAQAAGLPLGTSGYALIGNGPSASTFQGFLQTGSGAVARTWNSKVGEVVSVADFGAVGDGVTDDTAAFNKFLLAANGRIALIPPAIYSVQPLTTIRQANNNVPKSIIGYGATLKCNTSSTSAILTLDNVHTTMAPTIYGFNLEGLILDANNLAYGGIYATGCFCMRWRDIEAKNGTGDGFAIIGDHGTSLFNPAPGGDYYNHFDSLFSHNNAGAGLKLFSISNAGGYYVAADLFTNFVAQNNGTYGINADYATAVFIGGSLESNTTAGVNLDHTFAISFVDMYQENNGGVSPAGFCYVGTANTKGLTVLGGRTIGNTAEFTASLLSSGFNNIDTGDQAGARIIAKGLARFTATGIQFQNGSLFSIGPAGDRWTFSNSASAAPTGLGGDNIQIVGATNDLAGLTADAIASQAQLVMRRGNGTNASPSQLLGGQNIGAFGWGGYDSNNAWTTTNHGAQILAQTYNAWSNTDHSTQLGVYTTPSGSTTLTEILRYNASGGIGVGTTTDPSAKGALLAANFVKSNSPSAGVGYAAGAGGTIGQASNKTTGFTLSTITGQITLAAGNLAAGATAGATWTNTSIAATDVVAFSHVSGGTIGAYSFNAACGGGTATFNVTNISAGALNEQPVVQFVVVKGVTS